MKISAVWGGMKIGFLIIGTTIGAGYASGREIWEFFSSYGEKSSIYVLLSMVLFSVACYIIMNISCHIKSPNYTHVLEELAGRNVARVYDLLIMLYLISITVIMFAGSGAALEYWGLAYWIGVILMGVFVFLIFIRDVEGIISINSILIPILIMTLISVCLYFLWHHNGQEAIMIENNNIFPSSIAFAALNILPLIAVLSALGKKMKKEEIKVAGIVSGIGLCLLSYLYNESLIRQGDQVMMYEIPLYSLLTQMPSQIKMGITFVLWLAILTTAISGILGIVSRVKAFVKYDQWKLVLIIIIILIPLTQFGFANLIRFLYPLYGVLNLFILCMIILYPISKLKRN